MEAEQRGPPISFGGHHRCRSCRRPQEWDGRTLTQQRSRWRMQLSSIQTVIPVRYEFRATQIPSLTSQHKQSLNTTRDCRRAGYGTQKRSQCPDYRGSVCDTKLLANEQSLVTVAYLSHQASIGVVFQTSCAKAMSIPCRFSMVAAFHPGNASSLALIREMDVFCPTSVSATRLRVR